jgi:hypothetical protein
MPHLFAASVLSVQETYREMREVQTVLWEVLREIA